MFNLVPICVARKSAAKTTGFLPPLPTMPMETVLSPAVASVLEATQDSADAETNADPPLPALMEPSQSHGASASVTPQAAAVEQPVNSATPVSTPLSLPATTAADIRDDAPSAFSSGARISDSVANLLTAGKHSRYFTTFLAHYVWLINCDSKISLAIEVAVTEPNLI